MDDVGVIASKMRPSALSRWLDAHRHARLGFVLAGLAMALALALASGIWWDHRLFVVNSDLYVAAAGLFIVALAIERATELVVAPWVGGGDQRITRNVMVGTFALVLGVAASALLGLRLLSLLSGTEPGDDWLSVSLDAFATGLAIGAGTKPLHDLITNLEKRTKAAKSTEANADRPPVASASVAVDSDRALVAPSGGAYRVALAVGNGPQDPTSRADLADDVQRLLPGWSVFLPRSYDIGVAAPTPPPGSVLAHRSTPHVPGSPAFLNEQFAAAQRMHGVGLDVTVVPAVVRTGLATTPTNPRRHSLGLLGVDVTAQADGKGGRGTRIAALDTGLRAHADGVPWTDQSPGADVLDPTGRGEDPLLEGADWRDLDLMGCPGHGTGVAAVMAAPGASGAERYTSEWFEQSRMVGVAPEAAIIPIRVMRGPVHLLDRDVAVGVARAAIEERCDVISMSLGGLGFRDLEAAIDRAVERGIIVVCAAGNQFGVVVEPASYPTTIAVAGIDTAGAPYFEGSSRGPEVTISAPGVKVLRPDFAIDGHRNVTELLEPGTGTTYASAHVAGLAALWLARHGRDELLAAYGEPRLLPRLFAHVLTATATPWPEQHLTTDWGPGRANARGVLDYPVVADGAALVPTATLETVFERKAAVAVTDRFAGGVAAFLRSDGAGEVRVNAFKGLLSVWNRVKDRSAGVPPVDDATARRNRADDAAAKLLAAELRSHAGANPDFRRALASATDVLPVPIGATPELQLVMEETNREPGDQLPADWGVGLSRPLRQALHGVGSMRRGFRSVGLVAFALAVLLVLLLDDSSAALRDLAGDTGPSLAILGLGVYAGALAVERLLEFTVGRWAFRAVPGREMDRALILLGCGVFLGAIASMILDLGLLGQVAQSHTDDGVFRNADVVVTALAIGGGAKPIHDLLTRIKIGKVT